MLRIRREQMLAFDAFAYARREAKLVAHARDVWARRSAALSDAALREHVRACVARAEGYGLLSEYEASCFVDLTFAFSPTFDGDAATAWAGEILRDRDLAGWIKCTLLVERARRELRALEGAG